MNKYFSVIIGIVVGIAVSMMLIVMNVNLVAFGQDGEEEEYEVGTWKEIVALGNLFEWSDIFTPSKQGEDLYQLVYGKILYEPEDKALTAVAQKYALTKNEASMVANGSIAPLFNRPVVGSAELSQEDAYILFDNLQNDYADLTETFQLEQEIDAAIAPSEIFANGDLFDSGFDLVHDLSVIEEILFVEIAPTTVGHEFRDGLDSPYLPTEPIAEESDYIPDEGPVAVLRQPLEEEAGDIGALGFADVYGDIEALDSDICEVEDSYEELENAYNERVEVEAAEETEAAGAAEADTDTRAESLVSSDGTVSPAQPDSWGASWCPSLGGSDAASLSTGPFGVAGFSSLGNPLESPIDQAAGAAAFIGGEGFQAYVSVCLETELVWKTVSSFYPGDSCILCEVEKINEYMKKTLSHTLLPNKVTGNIMESAKCKQGYDVLGPDIKFITIAAPIPTPPNDDLIYGNNIFEEWNKFVERYRPFLGPDIGLQPTVSPDYLTEYVLETAPEDLVLSDVFNEVDKIQSREFANAIAEMENLKASNVGNNTKLFSQIGLAELRQMRTFFEGYNRQFQMINNACNTLENLPDIN